MAQAAQWIPIAIISFVVPTLETWFIAPSTGYLTQLTWQSLYLLHTLCCLGRLTGWRKWIIYLVAVPAWFQFCTFTMKDQFVAQSHLVNYLERCCWFWIPAEMTWAVLESFLL